MSTIVVVGSLNADFVVKTPHLPAPGETVAGGEFMTFRGGKGSNQAVAAARMNAHVRMIGRVGDDAFGPMLLQGLRDEGIDTRRVRVTAGVSSGIAVITVDPAGQNAIIVAPGANGLLTPTDLVKNADALDGAAVVMLQLEVPIETVIAAARLARERGVLVILDPAPAAPLPCDLLSLVDVLLPNEVEASALTGSAVTDLASAQQAARALRGRGATRVVIKLGAQGAWADLGDRAFHIAGLSVATEDTTAAGDAFAGALAASIASGQSWEAALGRANAAAALSTIRMGAQSAMPRCDELDAFLAARRL